MSIRAANIRPKFQQALVPKVTLPKAIFQEVEQKFGACLPEDVRTQILYATRVYSCLWRLEQDAVSARSILKSIRDIKGRTEELMEILYGKRIHPMIWTMNRYWKQSRSNLPTNLPSSENADVFLHLLLVVIIRGLSAVEQIFTRSSFRGIQSGNAWDQWVTLLSMAIDEAGLSTAIRKDGARKKRESPFVELVQALQNNLPPELRRTFSRDMLANAIAHARRRSTLKAAGFRGALFLAAASIPPATREDLGTLNAGK